MQLLIQALDCKWVAVEAAKVLQQVSQLKPTLTTPWKKSDRTV